MTRTIARVRGPGIPPPASRAHDWAGIACAALIAAVNVSVIARFRLPFLEPALGFWFLLIHPAYLLYTTSAWRGSAAAERLGYSLAAALLLLMLAGLAANTFLPLLGVQRPLGTIPVVVLGDTLTAALYLFRRQYPARVRWRTRLQAIEPAESRLLAGSGLSVALAVLGANRLNNGAGDQVSLVALGAIVVTLLLLLHSRRRVREGVIAVILYLLSLALLLMTSLRGWYVTGHDIQAEYRVFQLTQAHARWDISYFRDAYNACLSITILPTELARVVSVDGPYIYKVLFQVIFAVCPVLVYAIARRYWSRSVGILAAVYFVGFPTFFTDMPFLNRQEIAFLFVCVAILVITHGGWARQRRRPALLAAAVGIELSHYSTMYIFLGTLAVAWVAQRAGALGHRCWRRRADGAHVKTATWPTVGIGSILMLAVITILWGELATHTAGSAVTDARSAVSALAGHSGSTRSGNVSYGLLAPSAESPQTAVNAYRQATVQQRGGAAPPGYAPASVLARYRTPVVNAAPALPLTSVGGALTAAGIPVDGLNILIRQAAAKGEQVFIGVGLIAMAVARRLRRQVGQEFFCLCVGATAMLAIITVLPDLSGDYGILRAFQGALILVAPVLVTGSLVIFSPLGRRWGPRAAATVCLGIFVSTTGLLPQITGGYPAQLSLNNSGSYYNAYYMHPQEEAALGWLQNEPGVLPDGVQAENYTDQFYFTSAPDVTREQFLVDIYPSLVRQSSWVFLGYFTTRTGDAGVAANGDIITYAYPMGFLRDRKNLVYNNGGAEIYR